MSKVIDRLRKHVRCAYRHHSNKIALEIYSGAFRELEYDVDRIERLNEYKLYWHKFPQLAACSTIICPGEVRTRRKFRELEVSTYKQGLQI